MLAHAAVYSNDKTVVGAVVVVVGAAVVKHTSTIPSKSRRLYVGCSIAQSALLHVQSRTPLDTSPGVTASIYTYPDVTRTGEDVHSTPISRNPLI